jgi:C4-dicarboxylate transporter, DctM subunit
MNPGVILFLIFFALLLINTPVSFAMLGASVVTLLFLDMPMIEITRTCYTATAKFPLLAVPFFMLAGNLMNACGISDRIIKFSESLVGCMRGGLAMIAIVGAMIFGAISGAGTAATAAIGTILIPAMIARKYDADDSTAVVSIAGAIGVIIPPSIPMIIYGSLVDSASVGDLFKGGIVPGILAGVGLMTVAWFSAKRRGYPAETEISLKKILSSSKDAIWAFGMPVVILGGIFSGQFTATEAAAIAVAYGLFVGFVIYRTLKFSMLPEILVDSAVKTAIPMLLVVAASMFGWILASEQIPSQIADSLLGLTSSKLGIILIFNIIFLVVGTFMESISAMIILIPVLLPVALRIGLDPVHFGVITVFNLAIGMATPPVGANIFVASSISNRPLHTVSLAVLPYLAVMLIVLAIVCACPGLVLMFV